MRTVTVMSISKSKPFTLRSEASTWGQLKDALRGEVPDVEKLRAVVRETHTDLSLDEAVLPDGDFTLYLSQKQLKAGGSTEIVNLLESLKDKYITMIDELIEEAADGEFDEPTASSKAQSYTREHQDFFSKLQS